EKQYTAGDRHNRSFSRATEDDRIGIKEVTDCPCIELQCRGQRAFLADRRSSANSRRQFRPGNCRDASPLEKRRAERNGQTAGRNFATSAQNYSATSWA